MLIDPLLPSSICELTMSHPELNVPPAKFRVSKAEAVVRDADELDGMPVVLEDGSVHLSEGSVTAVDVK